MRTQELTSPSVPLSTNREGERQEITKSKRHYGALAAVLVLCVAVRIVVLALFPSVFAFNQTGAVQGSAAYDIYAQNLLKTGIYGQTPGVADAAIPPLYSYALALVYGLFGRGYVQVAIFHILLDVLSIAMLVEIGRRIMPRGEIVGLLAGFFYAVYPYLVFQNLTLIDTPIFMTLLHAFVLAMVLLRERRVFDRRTALIAVAGGIALGLAMLSRPVIAPFAAFVGLWFLFRLNLWQAIGRLAVVAITCVIVLVPWTIHTNRVYNAFVPVSTNGGMNFWFGNSQYTIPFLKAGFHPQWASTGESTASSDTREAGTRLYDLSFQFLRANPQEIPELLWVKFLAYWSIDVFPTRNPVAGTTPVVNYDGSVQTQTDSSGTMQLSGLPQNDPVTAYSQPLFDQIGRTVHQLYFGVLLILALIGVVLTARHWREVSLLWFVQISMTVIYVVFIPATRYRVPTDPMLFLFSAFTLVALWTAVRARRLHASGAQ